MKRTISILLLALIAVSCNKETYDPGTLSSGNKISITEVDFHPIGGTIEFTITAEKNWRVMGYGRENFSSWPWLTINKTSGGSGTTKVRLTAGAADDDTENAKIGFTIDEENIYLPFSQEKPMLEVVQVAKDVNTPEAISGSKFEWYHGRDVVNDKNFVLKVKCNTDWKVEYYDDKEDLWRDPDNNDVLDWLYCSQVESNSEKSENLPVSFQPNTYNGTGEERSVKFRIRGYDNLLKEFTLTQPGLRFQTTEPVEAEDGQSITELPPCNIPFLSMTVDSEVPWKVSEKTNTLVINASGVSTEIESFQPVNITVPTNPSREERKFTINVIPLTGQFDEDGKEISPAISYPLTQRPYILEFEGHTDYAYTLPQLENNDTGTKIVKLQSSGAWEVDEESVPDWIKFTSDIFGKGFEYDDYDKIELKLNATTRNYDEELRSKTIIVKSTEQGNELKTSLSVSQAKYILSQPENVTLNCTDGEKVIHTLSFDSSGKWRVEVAEYRSGKKDWLEFGVNSEELGFTSLGKEITGSGNGSVFYRAKEANTSETDDNVVKVRLTSVTHEEGRKSGETDKELYKEFTITHRKFVFDVTPDNYYKNDKFVFEAVDATKYYVDVDTSAEWEFVDNDNTWIQKIREENLTGGKKRVYIGVENNIDSKSRPGTFTIKSSYDSSKTKTFNVEQGGYQWKIENIPTGEFPAVDVGEQTIKVTCSGSWRITNLNADAQAMIRNWSKLTEAQQGDAKLEIDNNPNKEKRQAKFTIQSKENPDFKEEITLNQEAFEFDVKKKGYTAKLEFEALKPHSLTFSVTVSGEGLKYLDVGDLEEQLTKSGWFKSDNITVDAANKEITITPNENYELEPKKLDLTFRSMIGEHKSETFTLTQKTFEFDNEAADLSFAESLNPKPQDVTLQKSTGDWTVTTSFDWISVSPKEGNGSGEIEVTVEPYYTTNTSTSEQRWGTVYIQSDHYDSNNRLRKQINVTQKVFKLVADNTSVSLTSAKDSQGAVNITCSGSNGWECAVDGDAAEWLKAERTGDSITISALTENTSTTTEHTGKITVQTVDKNSDGDPLKLTISVTQAAATKK